MRQALAIALCVSLAAEGAVSPGVPAKNQAVLMMRVLLYDRNLPQRASESVVRVVVVSNESDAGSRSAGDTMTGVLEELARRAVLGGRKIAVRHVAPWELASTLESETTAAVYFAAGAASEQALQTARHRRALTFSTDGATAVGFVQKGDRVVISVNLKAARAEGADLDSELLALADVK